METEAQIKSMDIRGQYDWEEILWGCAFRIQTYNNQLDSVKQQAEFSTRSVF